MSTRDDDCDAELTTDWPANQPAPAPLDDGESTTVVPRHPVARPPHVPPASRPQHRPTPPPPLSPPQAPMRDRPGQGWQSGPAAPPPPSPPGGGWVPPTAPGYGQMPSGYPPAPAAAPSAKTGPRWGLIAGVTVTVAVLVAATVLYFDWSGDKGSTASPATATAPPTTTSSASAAPGSSGTSIAPSPSAPAPAPGQPSPASDLIDPATLSGFLASPADVGQLADNSTLTPTPIEKKPFVGYTVDPTNCTGAVVPGADQVYGGSGFTGFAGQGMYDDDHKVVQAITSFTTADAAQAFVDQQTVAWQACKYTTITQDAGDGVASRVTLGVTANVEGTTNLLFFPPTGTTGRQCEHSITPRNNVVVDVRVCAPSVGSMGWTLARDIGQQITGVR